MAWLLPVVAAETLNTEDSRSPCFERGFFIGRIHPGFIWGSSGSHLVRLVSGMSRSGEYSWQGVLLNRWMKGITMHVFIAGATGQVGRIAVEKAIAAGHSVTGMIRREEDREDLEAIGAKTYKADVTESESLDRAIAGHDAVVFAVGSQGEAVEAVDRDGAINLCDATKRAGIGRFVVLSSIGAGHPDDADKLEDYLQAKHEADEYVMSSGLDWTILRPGTLTDEREKGQIRTQSQFGKGEDGLEITRADVAGVIVRSLEEPRTIGAAFEFVEGGTEIQEALAQV